MLVRFLLLVACLAAFAVPPSASAHPSSAVAPVDHAHYFRPRDAAPVRVPQPSSRNLVYQGGRAGNGIQPRPRVYISFYGKQWGTAHASSGNLVFSNDPAGLAPVLQRFLRGLYGSTEHWST